MGLPKSVAIIQTAILFGIGILLLIPQFVSWTKLFKYGVFHSEKIAIPPLIEIVGS